MKKPSQICFLRVNFELQVNFLGEGFPSRALVELRADLRREEDKVHFSSTNRFFIVWKGSWFWLFTHFGVIKSPKLNKQVFHAQKSSLSPGVIRFFMHKITGDIDYCQHGFPDSWHKYCHHNFPDSWHNYCHHSFPDNFPDSWRARMGELTPVSKHLSAAAMLASIGEIVTNIGFHKKQPKTYIHRWDCHQISFQQKTLK